ncbi:MAG: AAA family ATPase [Nitrospirae bacterium]|nr:AAA family ATPase [Nitrospirota bacterium]
MSNDKILRLVDFLSALSHLSSKTIRSIDEYHKKMWIWEIPHEKNCYTHVWGANEEHSDDVWIEIKKFPEPLLPKIPEKCRDWVDYDTIRNTKDIPLLKENICIIREEQNKETGEKYSSQLNLSLNDFPEIQKTWEEYIDKEWLLWTEKYVRYLAVQKVYAILFSIYQEQQKLGEQYELVFCFGLLTWRSPAGYETKRHLFSAKASLSFEPHRGTFTVGPSADGDQVEVEFDMLDTGDLPSDSQKLKEEGRKLRDNLWDRAAVDGLLSAITNSLSDGGQGEYFADYIKPSNNIDSKPIVEYAPALILRKRSMRSLEELLSEIRKQIAAGERIPAEFLDLSEMLPEGKDSDLEHIQSTVHLEDTEIYFPLLANEEQRRIIETLNSQRGVLVQGPPGTGKSHTIANLICHLLATGKRVLVTAKTPRALQVLHDKLPSDIKPLCINLLGSGPEEKESMERSVRGILLKHDRWHNDEAINQIAQIERQIKDNREAKAATDAKIIALREQETYKHTIADGEYSGTAAEIARRLKKEEDMFVWLQDTIAPNGKLPLSREEVNCLCRDIVQIDNETERQLSLGLPNTKIDLPETEALKSLFAKESAGKERVAVNAESLQSTEARLLLKPEKKFIQVLTQCVSDLIIATETIQKRPLEWIKNATYDVLTDKDTPWRELLKHSSIHTKGLHELAGTVYTYDITIPADMDKKKLLNDAKALRDHFAAGGGTGFLIFKPKPIRDHGDFTKKIKVDGSCCTNIVTLKKLIDHLTVQHRLENIWLLWSGKAKRPDSPYPLQVAEIEELHEALQAVLNLYDKKDIVRNHINSVNGLSSPSWEDMASLRRFHEICLSVLARIDLSAIEKEITAIITELAEMQVQADMHPVTAQLLQAFNNRDIAQYIKLINQVETMQQQALLVKNKREMIGKLAEAAPLLAGSLARCTDPIKWSEHLKTLDKAWSWARGRSWLHDFLGADAESLTKLSARLADDIRKDISELASIKAWTFCFSRMTTEHSRHLELWQQSMKKGGKWTGKHAHFHRKNAKFHLNECREAVPAWIMPLHRVYETVKAGPGLFDVVIVDEASQCGPEALPLLYLGKRVLIVGDDKQISPEAVGVNQEDVQTLINNYLYDFRYKSSFDIVTSLFDHGFRFGNRITLREHFRCMPEIIEFSNSLCYSTDPLIPLRQYPPDRLEPLRAVYLQKGNREGDGQRVINKPEAEALVNEVIMYCKDLRYQGMTMGVIVLQGEAQAYLIEEMLLSRLGAEEMDKRRLICGNPYSFQGDERDVIFLSMVAAPNERIGVLTKESDRRRFNVAASRARDQMILFHSVTANHLGGQCFRRRLLDYFHNAKPTMPIPLGEDTLREMALRANRSIEKPPEPFDSWFEIDMALAIASRGYKVVPQFKFADKRIDLVIQGNKAQFAVECDGDFWHGLDQYAADMDRQRKLERCGWRFIRIRESQYYANPASALESLWTALDRMGILPFNADQPDETQQEDTIEGLTDVEEIDAEKEAFDEENEAEEHAETKLPEEPLTFFSDKGEGIPNNIHEALRVKPDILVKTIIEILHEKPNETCVRDYMATYILKRWQIRTRGLPHKQFARKVADVIAVMARRGYVTIYKSKNWRIKLGWETYE